MPTVVPLIFQSACLMLLNKSSCTTLMIPHTELLRTVFKILQHIASQSMKSKSWISELTAWAAATHQCIIYFKLTLADVKWCQCDHRHVLTIKPKLGFFLTAYTQTCDVPDNDPSEQCCCHGSFSTGLMSWSVISCPAELMLQGLLLWVTASSVSSYPFPSSGLLGTPRNCLFFCPVIHLLNHFTCGVSVERCALSLGDQTLFFSLCWGNAFYLLFMLLMPHPDTDIISLPFFMWFCHHLTNIHGLESGSLFFKVFKPWGKTDISQNKITSH